MISIVAFVNQGFQDFTASQTVIDAINNHNLFLKACQSC